MLNLLAIDDSLTIRKIVEMTLRGQAVNVTLCEDAKQGQTFLERTIPDLILLDYVLPDLNGAEFLASLPEHLQKIPVVIMTAKDLSIREQFRNFSQVIGYLAKPFSQNQLIQKIKKFQQQNDQQEDSAADDHHKQRQLAETIYSALEPTLTRSLRQWQQQGAPNTAALAAQSILTPSSMTRLLSSLEANNMLAAPSPAPATQAEETDAALTGHFEQFSLNDLLTLFANRQSDGYLLIHHITTTTIWIHEGAVSLAFPDGLQQQLTLVGMPHSENTPDSEHLPAVLPWFAEQDMPHDEQKKIISEITSKTLQNHYGNAEDQFSFYESEIPEAISALSCKLKPAQIHLQSLRELTDWTQVEHVVGGLDTLLRRASGFSQAMSDLNLLALERQVLAHIDGATTIQGIIEKTDRPTFDVFHVCFRLCRIGLIEPVVHDQGNNQKIILIADPDGDELIKASQDLAHASNLILREAANDQDVLAEAINMKAAAIIGGMVSEDALTASDVHWFPTHGLQSSNKQIQPIQKPIPIPDLLAQIAQTSVES